MRSISLLLFLLLASCSLFTPPPNKKALDGWRDSLSFRTVAFPDEGWDGPPLAPGQWAEYVMTGRRGEPAHLLYRVLAEEDGGFWLEFERRGYKKRTVAKALTDSKTLQDLDRDSFQRIFVLEDDEEIAKEVLDLPFDIRSLISPVTLSDEDVAPELVEVPAGRFDARPVMVRITELDSLPSEPHWYHAAVPITGQVRAETGYDRYRIDLVAFGYQGAEPAIHAVKDDPEVQQRRKELEYLRDSCCSKFLLNIQQGGGCRPCP